MKEKLFSLKNFVNFVTFRDFLYTNRVKFEFL